MAQVSVSIGGKNYRLACNEGEEAHLAGLAVQVDAKLKDMRVTFGEIGDQRLVIMAALTIADDLSEARKTIAAQEKSLAELGEASHLDLAAARHRTQEAALAIDDAGRRLEAMAAALSGAKP